MSCRYCHQPVRLSPSAAERSARTGLPASYFTALFQNHAECSIAARSAAAVELMRRRVATEAAMRVVL